MMESSNTEIKKVQQSLDYPTLTYNSVTLCVHVQGCSNAKFSSFLEVEGRTDHFR